jgi:hypothetical protein
MNTDETKSELWSLLFDLNGFKESVGLQKNKEVFEAVIYEIDQLDLSIQEKKKKVVDEFIQRIQKIDAMHREEMFEERLKQNQERYNIQPPNNELMEIKKLLYIIMDKLDAL